MMRDQPKVALDLGSFGPMLSAVVIGTSGGIGSALVDFLEECHAVLNVFQLSRSSPRSGRSKDDWLHIDLENEETIAEAAAAVERLAGDLHLVIVATGILHDGNRLQPEKTWRALTCSAMEAAFRINAIGLALVAKHFLPLLAKDRKTAFAMLSAHVGSIDDNRLGGWYAHRASKAALNMLIRTFSIELARSHPHALCVGLHPGTVDTALSEPFQSGITRGKLFSSAQSARYLLTVLDRLVPSDSGGVYAWDGRRISS